MIHIILLIVFLLQLAICSPLAVGDLRCLTHTGGIIPDVNSCHQVISAFSRKCCCLPSRIFAEVI